MLDLNCDFCKNLLEDSLPILLPCGFNICAKHTDQFIEVPCSFCQKTHRGDFQQNLKLSRLITSLNRAKNACSQLQTNSAIYQEFILRPLDAIKNHFDEFKSEILAEKERIVKHVNDKIEARKNECMSEIEDMRARCMGSIKVKPKPGKELDDVKSNIDEFKRKFQSRNATEDELNEIFATCDQKSKEINKKTEKLKEKYFINTKLSFQRQFDLNQPIEFGIIRENETFDDQNSNSTIDLPLNSPQPFVPMSPSEPEDTPQSKPSLFRSSTLSTRPFQPPKPTPERLNTNAKRFIRTIGHTDHIYCVCFDRTGRYIFTGSDDHLIKIWRVSDGMVVKTLRGHTKEVSDFHINYENTLLVSGGIDKQVLVWELNYGEIVYRLAKNSNEITIVRFSPKCNDQFRWFISVYGQKIAFYRYKQNNSYSEDDFLDSDSSFNMIFNEKSKITEAISFSKGGSLLVVGTGDGTMAIFLIRKNEPERVRQIKAHDDEITSLSFANLSLSFLTGSSRDGFMNIWSIDDKTWVPTKIKLEEEVTPGIAVVCNEVRWTCNDKHMIASICVEKIKNLNKRTNKIKVWSPKGILKHELNFQDQVLTLKPSLIHPHILLTAGYDGYLVLWDLSTGKKLFEKLNEDKCVVGACWSPNEGERFVSTDSEGSLSIFGFGNTPNEYRLTPNIQLDDQKTSFIEYVIEPMSNNLLKSSKSIRLADFNKEEEVIENELGGLYIVKVECFKESRLNKKRRRV